MPVPVITHDYERLLAQENRPVVVEFFASWCPKCAMMEAVFERIACRHRRRITFWRVDVDRAKETAARLGISVVPTFVVYKNGAIAGYTSDVLPEAVLEERIFEMLESFPVVKQTRTPGSRDLKTGGEL